VGGGLLHQVVCVNLYSKSRVLLVLLKGQSHDTPDIYFWREEVFWIIVKECKISW
jgi:hypothetical protein